MKWIPVNSIDKISDSWIRDLGFNPISIDTKNQLVSWSDNKKLS